MNTNRFPLCVVPGQIFVTILFLFGLLPSRAPALYLPVFYDCYQPITVTLSDTQFGLELSTQYQPLRLKVSPTTLRASTTGENVQKATYH